MPNLPFSCIRKYNRLIMQGSIMTVARVVTDIVVLVIVDGLV
jgi:hypothetical protein